jgi:hypothetical protein
MSTPSNQQPEETTIAGTLAWTGLVVVFAVAALLLLSWLGPVGGR